MIYSNSPILFLFFDLYSQPLLIKKVIKRLVFGSCSPHFVWWNNEHCPQLFCFERDRHTSNDGSAQFGTRITEINTPGPSSPSPPTCAAFLQTILVAPCISCCESAKNADGHFRALGCLCEPRSEQPSQSHPGNGGIPHPRVEKIVLRAKQCLRAPQSSTDGVHCNAGV